MAIKKELPVAVIDSGVGGVSVLCELSRLLPGEDLLYFGDSANAPYGEKSGEEVLAITRRNLEMLKKRGIKALVIACNTATGAAAATLRAENPTLPIIGIEPAIKPATLLGRRPRVLVMATPLTLKQEKFCALAKGLAEKEEILAVPCPGLVDMIEHGILDGPELEGYLKKLLFPHLDKKIDALVLGCTHYPHIKASIAACLPHGVAILDGGEGTARQTVRLLAAASLLREGHVGRVSFESSDPRTIPLAKRLYARGMAQKAGNP